MTPFSITIILLASLTVESLCAMMRVVRPAMSLRKALATRSSLSTSKALVASSRIKILGFLRTARAMARRCCCPPLSESPRSPMCVE
mmetsp:Transcript_38528/g.53493  ORF Transcript_38528/g.53493 Transcript_38528/m.53493 type:complete len:87 (-) Transcript_38528:1654-1914(-)